MWDFLCFLWKFFKYRDAQKARFELEETKLYWEKREHYERRLADEQLVAYKTLANSIAAFYTFLYKSALDSKPVDQKEMYDRFLGLLEIARIYNPFFTENVPESINNIFIETQEEIKKKPNQASKAYDQAFVKLDKLIKLLAQKALIEPVW